MQPTALIQCALALLSLSLFLSPPFPAHILHAREYACARLDNRFFPCVCIFFLFSRRAREKEREGEREDSSKARVSGARINCKPVVVVIFREGGFRSNLPATITQPDREGQRDRTGYEINVTFN